MFTDDFYKKGFYILAALIALVVFILAGKGIATYCIATDTLAAVYTIGAILIFITFIVSAYKTGSCLLVIILGALMIYIFCLTACESNYKVVRTEEGITCTFETAPYRPVTLLSGSRIDTLNVNCWLNRKTGGKIEPEVQTVLLTTRHDGSVSLSSLCNKWAGFEVYIDFADSISIERRQYFDWYYDVFNVWQGDSTYTVDIRGHNPDLPGYCPLVFIDDTNVDWSN